MGRQIARKGCGIYLEKRKKILNLEIIPIPNWKIIQTHYTLYRPGIFQIIR